ncbi:hypothetical protein MMPV_000716 [Pyropia vietnamensis]
MADAPSRVPLVGYARLPGGPPSGGGGGVNTSAPALADATALGAGAAAAAAAAETSRGGRVAGGGSSGRSARAAASAAGPSMGGGGGGGGASGAARPAGGFVHRESTRVRSNVAEQVRRDLHPASLLLTLTLVSAEVAAEVGVLAISQGAPCDRPLRPWLLVLIVLQLATIVLSAMRITNARSRNARLAAEEAAEEGGGGVSAAGPGGGPPPLLPVSAMEPASRWPRGDAEARESDRRDLVVSEYLRQINWWFLVCFVLSSVWVSNGGTCAQTAPHLYRLAVALTVIYYALLFLPLACFCLIVCCLPLFIVLYRLALPYAEREWRRARSADEAQLAALPSTPYTPGMLSSLASGSGSAAVSGGGPAAATTATTTTPSAVVSVTDGGIVSAAAAGAAEEEEDEATCVICLCEYVTGELVTFLPCRHHFHQRCINEWLVTDKSCPLCKQDIDAGAVAAAASASAAARGDAAEQEAAGGGAVRLAIGSPSGASSRGGREEGGSSGREDERLASQV